MENITKSYLETIGKNIKQFRMSKGLSQEKLAENLQKSINFVSLLENGKTGLSIQTIVDICSVLEIDANSLFSGIITPQEVNIKKSLAHFNENDKAIVKNLINYIADSKKIV